MKMVCEILQFYETHLKIPFFRMLSNFFQKLRHYILKLCYLLKKLQNF